MNRYRFFVIVLALSFTALLSLQEKAVCSDSLRETEDSGLCKPQDIHILVEEAQTLLENGDFAKARQQAEKAILESERQRLTDIRIQALFVKAKTIGRQGYLLDSLQILKEVLEWRKKGTDLPARVDVYIELARSAADIDIEAAESYLDEAEKGVAAITDARQQKSARAQLLAGRVYPSSVVRDLAGVIDSAAKAAALYRELDDGVKEANALLSGASAYLHQGEYDTYIKVLAEAEDLYTRKKYPSGQGKTVLARGMMYSMLGEYSKAEEAFQESLRLQKQAGNKAQEVKALSLIGNLYHGAAAEDKARDFWEKGLVLAREINDIGSEIWIQSALADLLAGDDPAGAESLYRNLVEPAARTGNKGLQADVLHGLGDLLLKKGQYSDALGFLSQAVNVAMAARGGRKAAMIRASLITLYSELGEYEKALDQANLYLRELTDTAIPWLLPNAFALRAGIYERLSRDDKALEDYREGMVRAEKNQDRLTAASLAQNAALIHGRAGRHEEALRLLVEAEQGIVSIGSNEELLSSIFLHLGETLTEMGRFDEAVLCYTEALALSEKMGRGDRIADIAYILGNSSLLANHAYTALQFHTKALAYYEKNKLWPEAGKAYDSIASDYDALGKKEEAFSALARGIDAFEQARGGAGLTEFKAALQGRFASIYDAVIYECLSRGDVTRALEYVEREKSRSLLDLLGNTKIKAKAGGMDALADEEMALRLRIEDLQRQKDTEGLREAYRHYEMLMQRRSRPAIPPMPL